MLKLVVGKVTPSLGVHVADKTRRHSFFSFSFLNFLQTVNAYTGDFFGNDISKLVSKLGTF
jgi:hypothetical protein